MANLKSIHNLVAVAFMLVSIAGCSSSDDDDENGFLSASIVDMSVDDDVISVGDKTVMTLDFTYSADAVFEDEMNVVVVIRLPDSLQVVEGTSELEGNFSDEEVGPEQVGCNDSGDTLVLFDLDENDLRSAANPSGDADARLKLTLRGVRAGENLTVRAKARGGEIDNGCSDQFLEDFDTTVTVIGLREQ